MSFSDPSKPLAFYICAHQDDWFFFRGEQAFVDLRDANTVFILTTAGDAGITDGWWQARDQGAMAAVMRAAPASQISADRVTIHGTGPHQISKASFGSGAIYFLRLPDAHLSDLMNGGAGGLQAVDGSTTYASWEDFCETLKNIVVSECRAANYHHPWVNTSLYRSDPGHWDDPATPGINPGDHPDHTATGLAVRSFAAAFCHRAWWWSYSIRNRDGMRIPDAGAIGMKRRLFDAYSETVRSLFKQAGEPSDWKCWVQALSPEWEHWGAFSHAELAAFGAPDPYP
jgi:hypothetical protein